MIIDIYFQPLTLDLMIRKWFLLKFYIVQTLRAAGLILGIICRSSLNLSHESASPRARELNFLEREPKASPLPHQRLIKSSRALFFVIIFNLHASAGQNVKCLSQLYFNKHTLTHSLVSESMRLSHLDNLFQKMYLADVCAFCCRRRTAYFVRGATRRWERIGARRGGKVEPEPCREVII